jgi:5-methylcytosine-specific restriction endonuclease McrA
VIPVNKGGKSTWDNGQCLCQSCNSKKGDQTDDGWDFRRFYPDFMKQCEQEEERGTFQGNLF